jgi:hypothetical protein
MESSRRDSSKDADPIKKECDITDSPPFREWALMFRFALKSRPNVNPADTAEGAISLPYGADVERFRYAPISGPYLKRQR